MGVHRREIPHLQVTMYHFVYYINTISLCECESNLHSNEHYLSSSEKRPEKILGLYGIWTHDLCNTSAVLYQLS